MSAISEQPVLVYWKLKARGHMAHCMLAAGSVDFKYDDASANAWPASKASAPFGQLPMMTHNGSTIAQSFAVARYCARLAGLMPADSMELAKVDMIIDHTGDIFAVMAKAKNAPTDEEKAALWAKAEAEQLPAMLAFFTPLLNGKKYYGGDAPNAADVALYSLLDIIVDAGVGDVLKAHPELNEIMAGVKATGRVQEMESFGPYLVKEKKQ